MAGETRTTIHFQPPVYRALKIKRRKEPSRPFEKVLEDLKRDGLL
jgi:hypothetical protein